MIPCLSDKRVVVVQAEASPGVLLPWIPVGLVVWEWSGPHATIVVKLTFSWRGVAPHSPPPREGSSNVATITAVLAESQDPLLLDQPHPLAGAGAGAGNGAGAGAAAGELFYASDFVPRKAGADVLLVGHARSPVPTDRISGSLTVGPVHRSFHVAAGGLTTAIPLSRPYVETDDGTPLGPSPAAPAEDPFPLDVDFAKWSSARGRGRAESLPAPITFTLQGLSASGPREMHLPDVVPTVSLDSAIHTAEPVPLVADTLWIDVDAERAVVVYRGDVLLSGAPALPDRIVLSLDPAETPREKAPRESALMRGHFGFAVGAPSSYGCHEAATEEEAERLEAARFETWGADAPPPAISLERYARLSARLVEAPSERARILASHDLDEGRWTIEERAWAERMANEALNGDGRLAERYAALFVEEQDALATPSERASTLPEYARLRASLEVFEDPEAALAERGATLASYLRQERRWESAARTDPALAEELGRLVERFVVVLRAADDSAGEAESVGPQRAESPSENVA